MNYIGNIVHYICLNLHAYCTHVYLICTPTHIWQEARLTSSDVASNLEPLYPRIRGAKLKALLQVTRGNGDAHVFLN